ncbi:MAG: carboxypeptidase-like regulatory domain-containing protein [Bacteroidetes bacterium]|nr:carboxypeptidase-like regulatory domain-containing protein [Bacteroidota bacterium]
MIKYFFITFLFFVSYNSNAQYNKEIQAKRDSDLIQFSGILLSSDSIFPIPFANISVLNKPYGTYSNLEGYFSFVARKGDSIVFSHVEFKSSYFRVPDTLSDSKYSIVKLMNQDTFYLPGVKIMPMPNRTAFDFAFVNKEIPNDDLERAKINLEREALREQAMSMKGDAYEAYKNVIRQNIQKSYYAGGQLPAMNVLNPFAWVQFFEAWKNGDYKKKKPVPIKVK